MAGVKWGRNLGRAKKQRNVLCNGATLHYAIILCDTFPWGCGGCAASVFAAPDRPRFEQRSLFVVEFNGIDSQVCPLNEKALTFGPGLVVSSEWQAAHDETTSASVADIASRKSLNFFTPPTSLIRAIRSLHQAPPGLNPLRLPDLRFNGCNDFSHQAIMEPSSR
jgi:hypothetical protein